jgi:hypothetical protein
MMLSSLIQHRTEAHHFGRLSPGEHTRLRRSAKLARDRTANPVEQRAIRSFAPARTPKIPAKAIRSPASAQLPQHSRRRQIPIAPLHCRCLIPRDFVPWRFSDAGCPRVGMVSACRHPKTCTLPDSCTAASGEFNGNTLVTSSSTQTGSLRHLQAKQRGP